MTSREIVELVRGALNKARPDLSAEFESIGIDTRFESLRIDSIDILQMVTFMEDKLGFVFHETDLARIETVKELAALIEGSQHCRASQ
jgi:acyl carrier protein